MALPSSGPLTAAMINVELGRAADAPFSLNGAEERGLAGKLAGAISFADFYGKSNGTLYTVTVGSAFGQYGYADDSSNPYGSLTPFAWNGKYISALTWLSNRLTLTMAANDTTWTSIKIGAAAAINRTSFSANGSGLFFIDGVANPFGTVVGATVQARIK
ncbi:hypothetical protein [Cupriavidus metallidurans]